MKDLTVEDVARFTKKGYWDKMKGDELPGGLDLCVFDFGVNVVVGQSGKYLQTMIGTVADGGIGPNTLKKLGEYVEEFGVENAIKRYQKQDKNIMRDYQHLLHLAEVGQDE